MVIGPGLSLGLAESARDQLPSTCEAAPASNHPRLDLNRSPRLSKSAELNRSSSAFQFGAPLPLVVLILRGAELTERPSPTLLLP